MNSELIEPLDNRSVRSLRWLLPLAVIACVLLCLAMAWLLYAALSAPVRKPNYQDYDPLRYAPPPDEKRVFPPAPPREPPPPPPK